MNAPQKLTAEELKTRLPLVELAPLLQVPAEALANVAHARVGCVPALVVAGCPPATMLRGTTVWNRAALLAHLADPARQRAARKVVLEQGLVGVCMRMVADKHLAQVRAAAAADGAER